MDNRLYDKALGAYMGSVIGDAMGGPVEGLRHDVIQKLYGRVTDFLEYDSQRVHPGGALTGHPGSYTDDTIGKNIIASAVIKKGGRVRAEDVVEAFLREAYPEEWWPGARLPFYNMKYLNIPPRITGFLNFPGGGSAWYTPLAIVNACNPVEAAYDSFDIASIWKTGADRDLVCSVQAGVAEAMKPSSTMDSVIKAATSFVGKEAREYILRAIDIASKCKDSDELTVQLYSKCLVDFVSDSSVFPNARTKYARKEGHEASVDLREQVPVAFAMFYISKGEPKDTITAAVNFGRDCDTIAASAGALAGAFKGARAIPQQWIDTVVRANPMPDLFDICKGLCHATVANLHSLNSVVSEVKSLIEDEFQNCS